MQVERTMVDNALMIIHMPTDREIQILKALKEDGYLEFRSEHGIDNEQWTDQKKRFSQMELNDLYEHNFIKHVDEAWHTTFKITELGLYYLDNLK